jgi:hypothetical protein
MAVIVNTSNTTRVFFLGNNRRITIVPGELYLPPAELEDDVKRLIKSKFFQSLVDLGFMAVSNKKSDILKAQKTPEPPDMLDTTKRLEGTNVVVSANQDATFNANPDKTLKIIGSTEL